MHIKQGKLWVFLKNEKTFESSEENQPVTVAKELKIAV